MAAGYEVILAAPIAFPEPIKSDVCVCNRSAYAGIDRSVQFN